MWLDKLASDAELKNQQNSLKYTNKAPETAVVISGFNTTITVLLVIIWLLFLYKLKHKLNNPSRRVGFLFFLVGTVLLLVGFYMVLTNRYYDGIEFVSYIEALNGSSGNSRHEYVYMKFGTYFLICGLISFFFKQTIGRFVAWILHG